MISNRTYGIDLDVLAYNARIVADGNQSLSMQSIRDLNQFVISLKKMNLWANTIFWPLRANQNAGNGNTAYSLGGLAIFNGTISSGVVWNTNGLGYSGASFVQAVTVNANIRHLFVLGATIFSVLNNSIDDNFPAVLIQDADDGNPLWPSLYANFSINTGVVAAVTRGASNYFQSTRGGNYTGDFNTIAGVIRSTSQAAFRNGILISNETGLSAINLTSTASNVFVKIGGRGNGGAGVSAHALSLIINLTLTNEEVLALNNLYKSTLGQGLNLP